MLYFCTSILHSALECTLGTDKLSVMWSRSIYRFIETEQSSVTNASIYKIRVKINTNSINYHKKKKKKIHKRCMQLMHCNSKGHKTHMPPLWYHAHWNKAALSCPNMPLTFCLEMTIWKWLLTGFQRIELIQSQQHIQLTGTNLWLWGIKCSSFNNLQYWVSNIHLTKHWKPMFWQISSGWKTWVVNIRHDIHVRPTYHIDLYAFFPCVSNKNGFSESVLLDRLQ